MLESQYGRQRAPPFDDARSQPGRPHGHYRTASNTFPASHQAAAPVNGQYMQMHLVQPQGNHSRRTESVNTFSTSSSMGGGIPPPAAYRTSPTTDIRRSISSHSGGAPGSPQPNSYVALLRRQKATVWCDRAQHEDPRLAEKQRLAKARANLEVGAPSGLGLGVSSSSNRTSTGLSSAGGKVAAKIRHHGKPGVIGYSPENNYVGVGGVPLRLSATEVEGEDNSEDDAALQRWHHRRTGSSGRSSTGSGRRGMVYRTSGGLLPSNSHGGSRRWSPGETPERTDSLADKETEMGAEDSASGKARSFASGSDGERFDSVPDMTNAARRANNSLMNAALTREKSTKNPEDLRRRGSVDERTMTLTGTGRLFIANPD